MMIMEEEGGEELGAHLRETERETLRLTILSASSTRVGDERVDFQDGMSLPEVAIEMVHCHPCYDNGGDTSYR